MEKFNEDVTANILVRLPAQAILKFRRVCKTWGTLLTQHYFVSTHIQHQMSQLNHHENDHINQSLSRTTHSFLCLIKSYNEISSQVYHLEFVKHNIPGSSYIKPKKLINHPPLNENQNLVGSCNGLVCFSLMYRDKRPTYICNTITKEFINIPRSSFSRRNNFIGGTSGFGYIPSTGEYKIVNVCYDVNQLSLGHVLVFTLGGASDSKGRWRKKEYMINYPLPYPFSSGIFLNGSLHWFCCSTGKIVSFDLVDEQFRLIDSEPFIEVGHLTNFRLRVLGRWLCLGRINGRSRVVEIWLLKKNNRNNQNVKEEQYESWSWIKEYNIILPNNIEVRSCAIISIDSRGVILGSFSRGLFYWYDLKTKTLEVLDSSGFKGTNFVIWDNVIPHVNSFVSLKDIGEEGEVIDIKQTRSRGRHS